MRVLDNRLVRARWADSTLSGQLPVKRKRLRWFDPRASMPTWRRRPPFPSPDQDPAALRIELAFGERQRLVDPPSGRREEHDQRSRAQSG